MSSNRLHRLHEEMDTVSVRQAMAPDTESVSSILQEAANWLVSQDAALWKADELAPDKIRADVSAGLFWLAVLNGQAVGCVRFQTEDELFWPDVPPGESAFIHRLAVRRKSAGGTISSALIDWAKEHAAELGKRYLRLDCEAATTKLCQVYERAGSRKHSERRVGPYWVARYEYELAGSDQGGSGAGKPRT